MARRPRPGHSKTRLCPPLSFEQAAALYECMLKDTLDIARQLLGVSRLVAVAPPPDDAYFGRIAPDFERVPQRGKSLTERLDHVMTWGSTNGLSPVVALDSDSPTLPAAYVAESFALLEKVEVDVVLGPTQDGGYYLIGWKRPHPRLIREVRMSTPRVLHDTLAIAAEEGLRVALLPAWYDVDTIMDVHRLKTGLSNGTESGEHSWGFLKGLELAIQEES